MRILTVKQPWASAIISGHKTVENRSTNVAGAYRGPIAIHAGAREDVAARSHPEVTRWAREQWGVHADSLFAGDRSKFRHIIGVVELVGVHTATPDDLGRIRCQPENGAPGGWRQVCSPWADESNYHLVFENARPLVEPIPYRGALGLRTLDADTIARILAQTGDPA